MKKIILVVIVFLICGCNNKKSASIVVKEYLDEFIHLKGNVKNEINNVIDNNKEFNNDQKKLYKDIIIRGYKSLRYDIVSEEYDADKALITVNINVYDLNKAEEEALSYLSENLKEFYDENNNFDNEKYISYKLNLMKKTESRIDYEVIFFLTRKNNKWILEQPNDSDLEKIHGIYKS